MGVEFLLLREAAQLTEIEKIAHGSWRGAAHGRQTGRFPLTVHLLRKVNIGIIRILSGGVRKGRAIWEEC